MGAVRSPQLVCPEPGSVMKVLHVIPSFYPALIYGGPIVTTRAICQYTTRLGCEVRVLTTDANGPNAILDVEKKHEVRTADGFQVRYCPRFAPPDFSPKMLSLISAYSKWADVIHLTAVYSISTLPTLAAAKMHKKPVVWSLRGSLQTWSGSTRRYSKAAWNSACRLLAARHVTAHVTSEGELESCQSTFPNLTAAIVPNGVDIPTLRPKPEPSNTLRILFLGRLHALKGVENLLEACAQLKLPGPAPFQNWSLIIAGGGDDGYSRKLRERIAMLGLSDRVQMPGFLSGESKDKVFAETDVLVLPSFKENFGMAVAEALARGVPVIAGRSTPWKKVEDEGCGLWTDNDPGSLSKALQQIAAMPMEEMGNRGRQWMIRSFGWERRARQLLDLYCAVTGRARAR
jgi:glycosyltransferase involved in cell wall biosynthesis